MERHDAWGRFGEQACEASHRLGNVAAAVCDGASREKALALYVRTHLLRALADPSRVEPPATQSLAVDGDGDDDEAPAVVAVLDGWQ